VGSGFTSQRHLSAWISTMQQWPLANRQLTSLKSSSMQMAIAYKLGSRSLLSTPAGSYVARYLELTNVW
jgi:hypothetical protein